MVGLKRFCFSLCGLKADCQWVKSLMGGGSWTKMNCNVCINDYALLLIIINFVDHSN